MGELLVVGEVGSSMGKYGRSGEICWGVGEGKRKYGRCGGWGVGVWKCVWSVGRGVERVLGWGQRVLDWGCCRKRGGGGAGKCGKKGGVTIWDPNSPDLTPPPPPTPTPLTPTPPPPPPPPRSQLPKPCVFWPQCAFLLFLNCGLNARFVEYLEETKLEFFQT